MKQAIFLLIFLIGCNTPSVKKKDDVLLKIQLMDFQGNQVPVSMISKSKLLVVIFLSPQCPICQGYSITMRQLWQHFTKQDVHFAGIIPGNGFTVEELNNFRQVYKIPFEILIDPQKELTEYLNATVTPQCFVLDNNGKIIYNGKIDDYAVAPGITKQQVTKHYLSDVLNEILANKKVTITKTEPAGCFITP